MHDDTSVEFRPVKLNTAGRSTTEFWLAVLVLVAATVLLLADRIDAAMWAAAAGVSSGGYSVSRGLAKL